MLRKLTQGQEDVSILVIGDSTGSDPSEWVYLMSAQLAARHPAYTVVYYLWAGTAYDAGTTLQTGTGARTLRIWNCSVSGVQTHYTLGSRWPAAVVAPCPDLVLISHGKNEGAVSAGATEKQWRGQYLALTESVALAHPYAKIVCILQCPNIGNVDMALKARAYAEIAALRGYGVVDVHQAFIDTGECACYVKADGVHPTTADDAPCPNGSALWAKTVVDALYAAPPAASQPQSPITCPRQILVNGDFADFAGAVPAAWTAAGATTSRSGSAVRIQATGSAPSSIYQDVPPAPCRGKWVTLAVRLKIPTGQGATAGRIYLADGTQVVTSNGPATARDGFMWQVVSMRVAQSAVYLRAGIYADSAPSAGADVTVEGACLAEGVLPRCW